MANAKPNENKAATEDDIDARLGGKDDASHPNAVGGAAAGNPAKELQEQAEASADIEDEVVEANKATANGGAAVLVGDARDGQPVLHNDPATSEPAELLTVADPNRIVQPDGSVEPLGKGKAKRGGK